MIRHYFCPGCAPYEDFDEMHTTPALREFCDRCGGKVKFVETVERGFLPE
jgi:transcription initiation factor IIE alpha subunit